MTQAITIKDIENSLKKIEFHGKVEQVENVSTDYFLKIFDTGILKNIKDQKTLQAINESFGLIVSSWLSKNGSKLGVESDRSGNNPSQHLAIPTDITTAELSDLNRAVSFIRLASGQLQSFLNQPDIENKLKDHEIKMTPQSYTFYLHLKGTPTKDFTQAGKIAEPTFGGMQAGPKFY